MQNKLMSEYVEIKKLYKEVTDKYNNISAAIVADLIKNEAKEPVKDPVFGTFTLARKRNWTYTESVKKLEEKVKIQKTKEQQKGLAKSSETPYLVYTAPKAE